MGECVLKMALFSCKEAVRLCTQFYWIPFSHACVGRHTSSEVRGCPCVSLLGVLVILGVFFWHIFVIVLVFCFVVVAMEIVVCGLAFWL